MSELNADDLSDVLWRAYYPGGCTADLTWARWVADAKTMAIETDTRREPADSCEQKTDSLRNDVLNSWFDPDN